MKSLLYHLHFEKKIKVGNEIKKLKTSFFIVISCHYLDPLGPLLDLDGELPTEPEDGLGLDLTLLEDDLYEPEGEL